MIIKFSDRVRLIIDTCVLSNYKRQQTEFGLYFEKFVYIHAQHHINIFLNYSSIGFLYNRIE